MTEARAKKLNAILDRYVAAYERGGLARDEYIFAMAIQDALQRAGKLASPDSPAQPPCVYCGKETGIMGCLDFGVARVFLPACPSCIAVANRVSVAGWAHE